MNQISNIGLDGLNLIKHFEGCKLYSYKDIVGIPTIGWGSTYWEDGQKVEMGQTCTQENADHLLLITLQTYIKGVANLVTSTINQNQFDALVCFSYNLGLNALKTSTLLKKINGNPNDSTIPQEFNKWNKAGGKVVEGLVLRRAAEAALYCK